MADKFAQWSHHFEAAAKEFNVPVEELYRQARVETGGEKNPVTAKGAAGEIGITQFKRGTFNEVLPGGDITSAKDQIRAGAANLRRGFDKFGSWDMAHAAHNAGHYSKSLSRGEIPNPGYVAKIKAVQGAPTTERVTLASAPVGEIPSGVMKAMDSLYHNPPLANVTQNLGPKRPERPNPEVVNRVRAAVASIDPTLSVHVYSGKYPEGHPFGSPRHGTGDTIDFYVIRDGKVVPTSDPVHVEIFGALPKHGLNELGVGMARGGIHAGYGTPNRPPALWAYGKGSPSKDKLPNFPEHVKAVQRALGVAADGVYGDQTLDALKAVDTRSPDFTTVSAPPQSPNPRDLIDPAMIEAARDIAIDAVRAVPPAAGSQQLDPGENAGIDGSGITPRPTMASLTATPGPTPEERAEAEKVVAERERDWDTVAIFDVLNQRYADNPLHKRAMTALEQAPAEQTVEQAIRAMAPPLMGGMAVNAAKNMGLGSRLDQTAGDIRSALSMRDLVRAEGSAAPPPRPKPSESPVQRRSAPPVVQASVSLSPPSVPQPAPAAPENAGSDRGAPMSVRPSIPMSVRPSAPMSTRPEMINRTITETVPITTGPPKATSPLSKPQIDAYRQYGSSRAEGLKQLAAADALVKKAAPPPKPKPATPIKMKTVQKRVVHPVPRQPVSVAPSPPPASAPSLGSRHNPYPLNTPSSQIPSGDYVQTEHGAGGVSRSYESIGDWFEAMFGR